MPDTPRVLWLVSVTLPAAAAACGLGRAVDVSGGWLDGQLRALSPRIPLTVCSLDARVTAPREGARGGVRYRLLPAVPPPDFDALLAAETPALVHIWGTEYPAAAALHRAARTRGIPALVSIQGVMRDCAVHYADGVPDALRRSCLLQRAVDRLVPGALLDREQARFNALAAGEAALLAEARYVTGRTGFDRAAAAALAPRARYFFCGETLRAGFYGAPLWQPHAFGDAPVLLMTQGNYPLKNLHTALRALPAVLRRWPNAELRVAGWPPLDKGPLLRPVIDWMFPYAAWCRRLVKELGLAGRLRFTGPLDAAAMRAAYLDADVFLLPSYCENSPNSLGEAMLLGMPCAAAAVGGIPDLAQDGREARLYAPAGDAGALAQALTGLLADAPLAAALGQAARRRALAAHDPAANADAMAAIYQQILAENSSGRTGGARP